MSKPHDIEAWLSELGLPSADRDYKPGHERVLNLIAALAETGEALSRPKLRIRVAGTNGKGSTSHFLAEALQANGFKVGLYASPHIQTFHERIRVQGKNIANDQLLSLMEKVMPLALKTQTSYFETATVLALLHFSHEAVDVEILEAGVGAKLDATTAVPADMGLLTSVALDHEAWLGNTLQEITLDKAHVFKGCKVALSAQQSAEVHRLLTQLDSDVKFAKRYTKPLAMPGEHQQLNAGLAWQAIQALKSVDDEIGKSISIDKTEQVISHAALAGRLEYVPYQKHHFWLDAAHNVHAVHALLPTLAAFEHPLDVIFLSTREDRDLSACLPLLEQYAGKVVKMTGDGERLYPNMASALSAEVAQFEQGRFLVLGSFITLDETIRWMHNQP